VNIEAFYRPVQTRRMARITGRQSKDRGPRSTAVLRSWDVWDADTLEPFALDFELGNGKWGAGSWELGPGLGLQLELGPRGPLSATWPDICGMRK